MKQIRRLVPYVIIYMVVFFLLPLFYPLFEFERAAPILLLVINPVACVVVTFLYGLRYGFDWYALLAGSIVYLISMMVYYDWSGASYTLIYLLTSVIGITAGPAFKRTVRR